MANINEVAESMKVPRDFLAKIVQELTQAGILESIRGVKGGFQLGKKPEEITLLDVIEIIQGKPALNACVVDKKSCELSRRCSVHPIWTELNQMIRQRLKEVNFADMTDRDRRRFR